MIDKKAKRLFLKYMENKSSLNHEEVEYIKEEDLLREDIVITEKEFITNLEKILTKISLEEVSNAFLYSLSSSVMSLFNPQCNPSITTHLFHCPSGVPNQLNICLSNLWNI